ncbi:pyridoxal phosphate-dependent aminotransferase [Hymenobacter sp. BT730]|uniref:pyridoxal phosphate-dependent aminotransferase n=1 Tax=Hymenobacter sp. BT730 TaxID=3063332 RepID=UPI0026E01AE3|nr:aminotransferase class I/II-fold pyridoxal phosphate-dependent enzyme [Hymenobacter sp. BT730]
MSSSAALISLASGYPHFPTPPLVLQQLEPYLQGRPLPTGPAAGLPELRAVLAHQYQAANVSPEQVVVTAGTKAALFAVLRAALRPGDEVLLPTPNWFGFDALIAEAGGTLKTFPLSPDDGYTLSPEKLAAALTPRTRILLFTNPCNPTGRIYTSAEIEALLHVTRRHPHMLVLSDEIYNLVTFGPPVPSLLDFPDPQQQHVVVNGFSKSLAMVSWGLGYLVAPVELAQKCARWQHATGGAVASLNQLAGLAAASNAGPIAADLLAKLQPLRQLLLQGLQDIPQVRLAPTEGTYYAFPDFRGFLDSSLSPTAASHALTCQLHEAGVDVVDGAGCHAPGFMRISCAVPESALRTALERLRGALLKQ